MTLFADEGMSKPQRRCLRQPCLQTFQLSSMVHNHALVYGTMAELRNTVLRYYVFAYARKCRQRIIHSLEVVEQSIRVTVKDLLSFFHR